MHCHRQRDAIGALLGGLLLLTGCAAGSPAVIAPTTTAPAIAASTAAPLTTAPAAEPQETAPQPAMPQGTDGGDAGAALTAGAVAYSQAVPDLSAPQVETMQPAQTEAVPGTAAQTDQENPAPALPQRPPPPPDPGTGLSEIIEGKADGRQEIALTFDAGADTGYASEILDLLRDDGIHATFGMTGVWAEANPELVQRMVAEGHQLINHTWDHASLTGANTGLPPQTPEEVAEELSSTENIVLNLTGYEMRPYFRPPYGDYDATSLGYLANNGYYLTIWWTCDTHGWAGWGSQEIIDYCTTNLAEDEILLLHVGAAAAGDFEALPGLIQFFRDNGYAFVTVEQMLQP